MEHRPPTTTATDNGFRVIGTVSGGSDGGLALRHGAPDIANVLYCDGHVKSKNAGSLLTLDAAGNYGQFTVNGGP